MRASETSRAISRISRSQCTEQRAFQNSPSVFPVNFQSILGRTLGDQRLSDPLTDDSAQLTLPITIKSASPRHGEFPLKHKFFVSFVVMTSFAATATIGFTASAAQAFSPSTEHVST